MHSRPCKDRDSTVLHLRTGQGSLPTPRARDAGRAARPPPRRPPRGPRSQAPDCCLRTCSCRGRCTRVSDVVFPRAHSHSNNRLNPRCPGEGSVAKRGTEEERRSCKPLLHLRVWGPCGPGTHGGRGAGDGAPDGNPGRAENDKANPVAGLRAQGRSGHSSSRLGKHIPSLPHTWHRVKPQRFQEPRPGFGEAADKVISPRTHRGWLPCCPSLPEALRGPCQHSKQKVTQQRPSRVRKNSSGPGPRGPEPRGAGVGSLASHGRRSLREVDPAHPLRPLGRSAGLRMLSQAAGATRPPFLPFPFLPVLCPKSILRRHQLSQ